MKRRGRLPPLSLWELSAALHHGQDHADALQGNEDGSEDRTDGQKTGDDISSREGAGDAGVVHGGVSRKGGDGSSQDSGGGQFLGVVHFVFLISEHDRCPSGLANWQILSALPDEVQGGSKCLCGDIAKQDA